MARNCWIKIVQRSAFAADIIRLERGETINQHSQLIRFHPTLDDTGLLRVGGRLRHSILDYDEKHPLLLPQRSSFTNHVIAHAHQTVLHGGTQLTLSHLRHTYWILGGRTRVRLYINRCITCLRQRATTATQIMGDLPSSRVRPSRPFLHSGVDYAGPIAVRTTKGRGHRSYKGYIALFVCFSTKAVHLEVVSDYTTEAFIAAYIRFTGRRGICATLSSD